MRFLAGPSAECYILAPFAVKAQARGGFQAAGAVLDTIVITGIDDLIGGTGSITTPTVEKSS